MQLSPHFHLSEFERSDAASILGVENVANPCVQFALQRLCKLLLQPLRDRFGPLVVTSGYRSDAVNLWAGGAVDSAHLRGDGADIQPRQSTVLELMRFLSTGQLSFDQAIDYGSYLHLSRVTSGGRQRRQLLMMDGGILVPWKEVRDEA